MSSNIYPVLGPKVMLNKINIGSIIVNLSNSNTLLLSNTDTFVVTLCNGKNNIDQIIKEVVLCYNLQQNQEKHAEEIKKFINSLIEMGYLFIAHEKIDIPQLNYLNNIENFIDENTEHLLPKSLCTIDISIIENCPLQCIYCLPNASRTSENRSILKLSKIKEVIDDAKNLGARNLVLSGGEPLLHPDIYEIIKYAYNVGYYDVKLSTKGTLINKDIAFRLRQAGLKQIQVSIDSNIPNKYEYMVGTEKTYNKMLQGLYQLMYFNFKIIVKSVITKYNINDIPNLCEEMISNGVDRFSAELVIPIGRAQKQMLPSLNEFNALKGKLIEIEKKYKIPYNILSYRKYGETCKCSAAINQLAVFSNGDVSLCERIAPLINYLKIGNVNDESITKLWFSEKINKFRKIRNNDITCKNCIYGKNLRCLGGCLLNSWIEYGDWYNPDPLCNVKYKNKDGVFGLE